MENPALDAVAPVRPLLDDKLKARHRTLCTDMGVLTLQRARALDAVAEFDRQLSALRSEADGIDKALGL